MLVLVSGWLGLGGVKIRVWVKLVRFDFSVGVGLAGLKLGLG